MVFLWAGLVLGNLGWALFVSGDMPAARSASWWQAVGLFAYAALKFIQREREPRA